MKKLFNTLSICFVVALNAVICLPLLDTQNTNVPSVAIPLEETFVSVLVHANAPVSISRYPGLVFCASIPPNVNQYFTLLPAYLYLANKIKNLFC